jgi:hypothetical protein
LAGTPCLCTSCGVEQLRERLARDREGRTAPATEAAEPGGADGKSPVEPGGGGKKGVDGFVMSPRSERVVAGREAGVRGRDGMCDSDEEECECASPRRESVRGSGEPAVPRHGSTKPEGRKGSRPS